MSDFVVSVSDLKAKVDTLRQLNAQFKSQVGELEATEMNLQGMWEGEAATAYITKFRGLEDDIQKMIRMIQEHSSDLQEMAQIYSEADMANAEEANSLSSDVIV